MKKKIVSAILAVLIMLTCFPISVFAAYENTHVNTGNQRYDIVEIALSQNGYGEQLKN